MIAKGKSFNFLQEIDLKIIFQNSLRFSIAFGTIYFAWWIYRFLQFCTYISCKIAWLIYWFFSPYHHTTTRWIPFSWIECHAIKSSPFFKIASESSSSKAVSLKIEVFEFNENRHFTETKNNGCQGSWLFISQVFLFLSFTFSLSWAPCIIADDQNTAGNNEIQQKYMA